MKAKLKDILCKIKGKLLIAHDKECHIRKAFTKVAMFSLLVAVCVLFLLLNIIMFSLMLKLMVYIILA